MTDEGDHGETKREGGGREGRWQGKTGRGRAGKHTGACGVSLEFQVGGRPRGELLEPRVCNLGNRKSEFP